MGDILTGLSWLYRLEVDVTDPGVTGLAVQSAFLEILDVAVVLVEEIQNVDRDFPAFLSIAYPGIHDEAVEGVKGSDSIALHRRGKSLFVPPAVNPPFR